MKFDSILEHNEAAMDNYTVQHFFRVPDIKGLSGMV